MSDRRRILDESDLLPLTIGQERTFDYARLAVVVSPVAVITGSGGLIGSESVRHFIEAGFDVVGIENDMRAHFFGPSASTAHTTQALEKQYPDYRSLDIDIRDSDAIGKVFAEFSTKIGLIVHAAAQPSHDWAASDPQTDFATNANGTLNLLEATREHAPDAPFIFMSTNKVYGDLPNSLPLEDLDTRLDLPSNHRYFQGIDETMSIDASMHSLFGVSKASADLLVQEYGRYFDMPTVCFRGGCLTGPNHAGAELHGFLSYLMRCVVTGQAYTVFGYQGKQVRDNIHSFDLVQSFNQFQQNPGRSKVYNMGGGRSSNCSMLEAIDICEQIVGQKLKWRLDDTARKGDHRWWISDLESFKTDYPEWKLTYTVESILREIYERNAERWS